MRSTPVIPPGFDHAPFECRLRFHRPLRGVEVVTSDVVSSVAYPIPTRTGPATAPPAPAPTPESPTPTPAAPKDDSQTDTDRELLAERQRAVAVLQQVHAGVADLRQDREGRIQEWQRAAVELATTIASRLLHERVVAGDFPIDAKVRDMIVQLGEDVPVTVRLNPTDLELLKDRLDGVPLTDYRGDPRFIPDPELNRGACQVDGRESMLLSDVSRELQEIRDDLLRSLDHARP